MSMETPVELLQMVSMIEKMIERANEQKALGVEEHQIVEDLKSYSRENNLSPLNITLDGYTANVFDEKLKSMGIRHTTNRCIKGTYSGKVMIMYGVEDFEKVQVAYEEMLLGKGIDRNGNRYAPTNRVSLNTLKQSFSDESKQNITFKNLEEGEVLALSRACKDCGVVYSTIKNKSGKTDFYFENKEKLVKKAICEMKLSSVSYADKMDEVIRKNNRQGILDNFENGYKGEKIIVSENNFNDVITLRNDSVIHKFGEQIVNQDYSTNYTNLRGTFKYEVNSMKNPIEMTEEEYTNFQKMDIFKKKDFIDKKKEKYLNECGIDKDKYEKSKEVSNLIRKCVNIYDTDGSLKGSDYFKATKGMLQNLITEKITFEDFVGKEGVGYNEKTVKDIAKEYIKALSEIEEITITQEEIKEKDMENKFIDYVNRAMEKQTISHEKHNEQIEITDFR